MRFAVFFSPPSRARCGHSHAAAVLCMGFIHGPHACMVPAAAVVPPSLFGVRLSLWIIASLLVQLFSLSQFLQFWPCTSLLDPCASVSVTYSSLGSMLQIRFPASVSAPCYDFGSMLQFWFLFGRWRPGMVLEGGGGALRPRRSLGHRV